ncbi:wall-associated receptor kinase 17-like isoform X2 [Miscanthus floridulus]|uniref:wall-associated receptor kinase 17-like isoform X2 n=1 Tax=Miscanthus floridulus TaxID=154761 RepID=UPI003459318F
MPRGRNRRSAADAVARPLALALALVSTLPRAAHSQDLALPPLRPPGRRPTTCDNVPAPFGTTSLPGGFGVICGPNREAMLSIGEHEYRIDSVSVPGSYVVIFAEPITQVCYDGKGKPTPGAKSLDGTALTSLEGTPFTFSQRNKLVNFGCNRTLIAYFLNLTGHPSPPYTSCTTTCTTSSISGSCHGEACCEASMDQMNGAKAISLSFFLDKDGEEDGTCSAAFFLDKDEAVFNFSGDEVRPLKKALSPQRERRMILDWAFGSTTCDQAQSYKFEPLCKYGYGTCVDAPSGAGYLCKCPDGYDGNPYVSDGCQDINECRNSNSNNCTYQNLCNNTLGSYTCSCPENNTGDGYRTGTGCNTAHVCKYGYVDAPNGAGYLSKCPDGYHGNPYVSDGCQGTGVCNTEKNPCTYIEHCFDSEGVVLCDCPEGMSGDGQRKGSGCYVGSQKHFPLDTVLGVGLALMVTVTTAVSFYCWAIKKRELGRNRVELFRKNGGLLLQQRFSTITSQGEDQSAKIFSAEELKAATDNYSESRILGRGGHGTVYKGILADQTIVAIKKSKVFDESQVEQFVNEIAILSQIDHPNVVKLLGCCLETQVPLLVYEFIPNGTLFQHIHNRNAPRPLTWEDCLRIAAETADALAYLHSTSSAPIIHRDIKSSNILLDENFVAKIADFGASRSVPFDQTHITTLIQGTIGYLDPEYFQTSQLTEKSDVYSFGVVLAELLTRQKPISAARPEESCNLAMHLVVLFNERRLLQEIEPHILAEAGEDQCYAVAELSVRCLNVKGEERPAMVVVASVLHGLRRSFTIDQTATRKHEWAGENSEQEEKHLREPRPIPSLQSSEVSTQCSMEAEMLSSSHMPR